jgi:hypothetical protein
MKFYVPTIGDKVYLERDWTFPVYKEGTLSPVRNRSLIKHIPNVSDTGWYNDAVVGEITLPAGTSLIIDRVYIRGRGDRARNFDSITFRLDGSPDKRFNKGRFWAKLRDANRVECSLQPVHDLEATQWLDPDERFKGLE